MSRIKSRLRRHPVLAGGTLVALVVVAGAGWVWAENFRLEPVYVDWAVPEAPQLTAGPDQRVYRIDPSRSVVSYEVEEHLAGLTRTATGETQGIAGDIVVDDSNPASSVVGDIVVNVEQLTSDQSLRDERIRQEFLESDRFPLARFHTTEVVGLPDEIDDGVGYEITLRGELTVKESTNLVELEATVERRDGALHISASTEVLLSDFDAGPIRIIGLVSTGDEATLRFELVAPDASTLRIETTEAAPAEFLEASGDDPRFSETVQPVLEAACAGCHQPGGSGSGVWQLATAGDAARIASGIGVVVEQRYMPPWLASEASVEMQHSTRLSDDQVQAVVEWADANGPLDIDPATRVEAVEAPGPELREDLVLRLPEPYLGSVDRQDDYRCFALDPGLDEPVAITGYEFRPDQLPLVHHALVFRLRAESVPAVEAAEARDAESGWECYGGINIEGTSPATDAWGGSGDLVVGWAPGQPPTVFDDSGIRLDPGEILVAQLHYNITEDPPPDRSALVLQLADDPATVDEIDVATYVAPAEIPCLPEETAPGCDRDVELRALAERYGSVGPSIANGLHLVCGTTPRQLAVLVDGIARSPCDHRIQAPGEVLAVFAHMHEIGSSFRITLNPDTPDERVVLDIPRWDFDWQFNYALAEPLPVEPGDVIRIECAWDRALIPAGREPRYVLWSEGTDDEMCFAAAALRAPTRVG